MSTIVDRAKSAIGARTPTAEEADGHVARAREALLAFGEGDLGAFFGSLSKDVEWVGPEGESFPASGTIHGRDELRERMVEDVKRGYETFGFRPEHYFETEGEDWVLMVGAFSGEPMKGRQQVDVPGAQLWEFDGDEVARIRVFVDSAAFPELRTDEEVEEDHKAEAEAEREAEEDDEDEERGSGEGQET